MKTALRRVVPVVLFAGVLTAVVFWWSSRDTAFDGLAASGTVEATAADLGFQLPGRIEEISPREGDEVRAGVQLAALERADLLAARDAAEAQLEAALARLGEVEDGSRPQEIAVAEAALLGLTDREAEARTEAERAQRLYEGGAISRQALDRAETALSTATSARVQAEQTLELVREGPREETRRAQRAQVELSRAQVARAEAALAQAVIIAPFPGTVTLRHREPGEVVSPGAPVVTLLDREDRWVRIYVAENQIGRVQIGQEAEIRSDTWPDRVYTGEVVFVGSEAEFTPRNVQTPDERTRLVYPVRVRITGDPDFDLKPGIPADVDLLESGDSGPSPSS